MAEASCVAVQLRNDDEVHVWSPTRDDDRSQLVSMRLEDLGMTKDPIPYRQARALFAAEPRDRLEDPRRLLPGSDDQGSV